MSVLALLVALQMSAPSFRLIDKGNQSGIDSPRQVVVRTAGEWEELWRVHATGRDRPKVDFGREIVVGVFMGSRPTAGFKIEIVGVDEAGGSRVVRYRESMPRRDAITAQVLTSPYELVAIPKTTDEIRFEKMP